MCSRWKLRTAKEANLATLVLMEEALEVQVLFELRPVTLAPGLRRTMDNPRIARGVSNVI